MTTVLSQVAGAVVTSLSAGTPVSSHIQRARMRPGSADWSDMVVVRLQDTELTPFGVYGGPYNADTKLSVECYARATAGQSPDVAVDSLLAAVYARLAADHSLGGLVSDLVATGISYDFDADDYATACATLNYTAVHRVSNSSLE